MLKSNAHFVQNNSTFQKVAYSNPKVYDERYDNDICEDENAEIKNILEQVLPKDILITDVGCGTGLGKRLINNPYIGIDIASENINHCLQTQEGDFRVQSAGDYIKSVDSVNPIFLFSMDYIDLNVIEEYIQKTEKIFVAIHYNKPYKSKTSLYATDEELFEEVHHQEKRDKLLSLIKDNGGITYNLKGEDFYHVSIIIKPDARLKKMKEYIQKVRWQEAKSYAKTAPHEYTIRGWAMELEDDFVDVVKFIRANGIEERFYSRTFIYLYLDGLKYWTMGDAIEETIVLNRAKI